MEQQVQLDPNTSVSVTLPAARWAAIMNVLNFSTGIPRVESEPLFRAIEGALLAVATQANQAPVVEAAE